MEGRSRVLSRPTIPYIVSRYLGHTVYLDELTDLTDRELALLSTEVHGLHADCSRVITDDPERHEPGSTTDTLLRTSGRFVHAVEQEMTRRQRKVSIVELLQQLNEVKEERDALRIQLDQLLDR